MPPISDARGRALEIVRQLGIKTPAEIDVENIAWVRGALVQELPLEGIEGRLVSSQHRGVITVREGIPEEGRKRFIIAHELGHFELHRGKTQVALCTGQDLVYFYKRVRPNEGEASEFASELLLPEPMVKAKIKSATPDLTNIAVVAEEFHASLTATSLRFIDFSDERCAVVVSEQGAIRWYRATEDFGYHLAPGTPLDKDTYAAEFFSGKAMPREMRTVQARAWLLGDKVGSRHLIKEQSWALRRYGAVLTLLWVYDAFDREQTLDEDDEPERDPDHFNRDGKRWRW